MSGGHGSTLLLSGHPYKNTKVVSTGEQVEMEIARTALVMEALTSSLLLVNCILRMCSLGAVSSERELPLQQRRGQKNLCENTTFIWAVLELELCHPYMRTFLYCEEV